jgi:hypothetical protein
LARAQGSTIAIRLSDAAAHRKKFGKIVIFPNRLCSFAAFTLGLAQGIVIYLLVTLAVGLLQADQV